MFICLSEVPHMAGEDCSLLQEELKKLKYKGEQHSEKKSLSGGQEKKITLIKVEMRYTFP